MVRIGFLAFQTNFYAASPYFGGVFSLRRRRFIAFPLVVTRVEGINSLCGFASIATEGDRQAARLGVGVFTFEVKQRVKISDPHNEETAWLSRLLR